MWSNNEFFNSEASRIMCELFKNTREYLYPTINIENSHLLITVHKKIIEHFANIRNIATMKLFPLLFLAVTAQEERIECYKCEYRISGKYYKKNISAKLS